MSHRHIDVAVLAEQACPVAEVIDHVSGRWTVGILTAAAQGPVRFVELERSVRGISRRMLTLKLRQLERDGLLTRTVFPIVPPHVEYTLTEIAAELLETLQGLTGWAIRHRGTVAEARAAYDRAHGESEHDDGRPPADDPATQDEVARSGGDGGHRVGIGPPPPVDAVGVAGGGAHPVGHHPPAARHGHCS